MTLAAAMDAIRADTIVTPPASDSPLTGAFAADLMSDVLTWAREGSLLITGLTSDQTIRTAAIRRMIAVVVIQGKEISDDMVEAAREEHIGLYQTPLSQFETCGRLMQAGLRPYRLQGA